MAGGFRSRRSRVPLTIVLSSVSVALCIAMVVGWILVVARNMSLAKEAASHTWLLVGGIASLVVIVAVLVLFTVFLVRETREVRRQISFIDSVTHELKSPLASLKLCAETMARPDLPAPRREELRGMMLDDVHRLLSVIDGILEASRLGSVWLRRAREHVDVEEAIRLAVGNTLQRHKLDPECIRVSVEEGLELVGDAQAFGVVLENLIDNALKYSPDDPDIEVRATNKGGRIQLEVSDHGIGIGKRDLERIFERFYRAPEESVRSRHGTGLGLFVVRALVREMRGRITAESGGPGRGTTIRMSFPVPRA